MDREVRRISRRIPNLPIVNLKRIPTRKMEVHPIKKMEILPRTILRRSLTTVLRISPVRIILQRRILRPEINRLLREQRVIRQDKFR
ncbi:hypothetical protein [Oribacterium sinus]